MKKRTASSPSLAPRKRKAKRASRDRCLTIGLAAFEKISAIEGLHLTHDMKAIFGELDRDGLSHARRRKAIVKRYG